MNGIDKPVEIQKIMRQYMVDKAINNKRKFDVFHPSAWGSCLRKMAFQYYNEKYKFYKKTGESVNDRFERIFDNGHYVHARWQKYLQEVNVIRGFWKCTNPLCNKIYGEEHLLGIFCPSHDKDWKCSCGNNKTSYEELLIKSDDMYNFEGHCDAVIDVRGKKYFERKNHHDVFVVDFKSIKQDAYEEVVEKAQAKDEHVVQVNIYMWVLELQSAVVLYENKNTQELHEEYVPRDENLITQIKKDAIELKEILACEKLPNRFPGASKSKYPCRGCEFITQCFP